MILYFEQVYQFLTLLDGNLSEKLLYFVINFRLFWVHVQKKAVTLLRDCSIFPPWNFSCTLGLRLYPPHWIRAYYLTHLHGSHCESYAPVLIKWSICKSAATRRYRNRRHLWDLDFLSSVSYISICLYYINLPLKVFVRIITHYIIILHKA